MLNRRDALLAATAAGLGWATRAGADTADDNGTPAHGTVFEARAGGRRGLPGVMVSNGQDVVLTASDGTWSLPLAPGESAFVVKPSGWTTPVDPVTQLPRFAWLHHPTGTPAALGFRFAGVAPTGALPDSIDFELRREDEPERFDALLMTDPQPESLTELAHVRDDVVARLSDVPASFGIGLGDLMFDDLAFYDRYNRMVATTGIPWHNCPGNHDINYEAPDDALSRETWKRVYGARHHAFQHGGATFILLDNVEYAGADPSRPMGAGHYRGHVGPRQLAFVRNLLAHVPRDALVVVCAHIPLYTMAPADPTSSNTTIDTAELLAALATHPNCISFSGHTHTNEHWYLGADGKPTKDAAGHHHHVLSAASGSWWSGPDDVRGIPLALATDGTPSGFHVLSVDGLRATTRLVPSHDPARAQLRIVLDSQMHEFAPEVLREYLPGALLAGPVAAGQAASTRVVANLFDGGPRSVVELAADDGPFAPMDHTVRIDPFVQEVYDRNPAARKPWVKPELSSHLWQARLPPLTAGTHRLRVRARDEHGRPHQAHMVLEIT